VFSNPANEKQTKMVKLVTALNHKCITTEPAKPNKNNYIAKRRMSFTWVSYATIA
jgi:hypothetical protein